MTTTKVPMMPMLRSRSLDFSPDYECAVLLHIASVKCAFCFMILTSHFPNNSPASPAISRYPHKSPVLVHQPSTLEPSSAAGFPSVSTRDLIGQHVPSHRCFDLCPHSNRFSHSLLLLPVFKTVSLPACSSNPVPTFPTPPLHSVLSPDQEEFL